MGEREYWLDTAKGIGIIAIVMGHSGNSYLHHYLFWFHIPLFFIVSGYLHKTVYNLEEFKTWFKKRTKQLLVPYFSFGIIISVVFFIKDSSIYSYLRSIGNLLYGGQVLGGFVGVFWFINCLYLTQILFMIITWCFKKVYVQVSILILLYIFAHIFSSIQEIREINFPWDIDAVLITLVFYGIGYYIKKYHLISWNIKIIFVISMIICIMIFILDIQNVINYSLDIKTNLYNHIFLDFLIPVSFSLLILSGCKIITGKISTTAIRYIGYISLTIMYLHIPINNILIMIVGKYNFIVFTAIGIIIPLIIHRYIFSRYNIFRTLFLGR